MQVIDVNRIHPEILETARELIFQVARRHRVAPRSNVLRVEHAFLNVLIEEILVGLRGHFAVGREIASFGADNDFVPRETAPGELGKRVPNAAFAALEAVVDRGIYEVDSAFHRGDYSFRVCGIGGRVGIAEVRADAERGNREASADSGQFPEMSIRRALGESPGVTARPFRRREHRHPFFSLSSRGASKREQARRMRR